MTLSALIRKRDTGSVATAIPASFATQPERDAATVARIATVAVANPENEKAAPLQSADAANDDADEAAHFAWLIHFTDRAPVAVTFSPMLDHAGVLAFYPDAVAAEPIGAAQSTEATSDDRHTCDECANLRREVCAVASLGGVVSANRGYRPGPMFREQPHRCEGFTELAAASG